MIFEGYCPFCEGNVIDMDTPTMFDEIEIKCMCDGCGSSFTLIGEYNNFKIVEEK